MRRHLKDFVNFNTLTCVVIIEFNGWVGKRSNEKSVGMERTRHIVSDMSKIQVL